MNIACIYTMVHVMGYTVLSGPNVHRGMALKVVIYSSNET